MNNERLTTDDLNRLGWQNPPPGTKYSDTKFYHNGQGFMVEFCDPSFQLYIKSEGLYFLVLGVVINTEEDLYYYTHTVESRIKYSMMCIKGENIIKDQQIEERYIKDAGFKKSMRSDSKVIFYKESTGERLTLDEYGTSYIYTIGLSSKKINTIYEMAQILTK